MRAKIVLQPELDFHPPQLSVTKEFVAKYSRISEVLDRNPAILDLVHADIEEVVEQIHDKATEGRSAHYASDVVLRMCVVQRVEGLSLRALVIRIDDSHYLRRFVRIDSGSMMDFTTFDKLRNSIRPETWKQINAVLSEYAVRSGQIEGDSLRIDSTLVETNIHWPTDSFLLWDVYRVLGREVEAARELDPNTVGSKRLHFKRAKRLHNSISRKSQNKSDKARKKAKSRYKHLIELTEGILDWSVSVAKQLVTAIRRGRYDEFERARAERIVERIERFQQLGVKVVSQARRRVLDGQQVPNDEKVFSIFEPHTELIKRGKQGKLVEFGHMIEIHQVKGKFITGYNTFEERPIEHEQLTPALDDHKELFGTYPSTVSTDKGYYESMDAVRALEQEKGISLVAIGKKGKRSAEETEREHSPAFRAAQRFRAGIEGTISFLKRSLGLLRCFNKGWDNFCSSVGAAIFAHNLLNLARA
jgi:IS5 family transposase